MTAPPVREQLTEALPHFPWCDEDGARDDRPGSFPCVCQSERQRLAEAALPTVERIAAERAASELADAANQWGYLSEGSRPVARFLRARAAALRSQSHTDTNGDQA